MTDKFSEQARVLSAGIFGMVAPGVIRFVEWSQPILSWLSTALQVGVGAATLLYVLAKWKAVRKRKRGK
jgi:hypothetical protein